MNDAGKDFVASVKNNMGVCFTLGLLVGALIFIAIWGVSPLNPLNIEWILSPYGSDFSFTGIGTLQYLKSEWVTPPGLTNGLLYPTNTSVVFFDAVPVVAIAAKVIRTIYPHDFQYFGIWGLFCMALQGGIASLIIRKYCSNVIVASISSAFFCLAPFLLGKMFGHPSMSGQFVILLPILLIWYRDTEWVIRHQVLWWSSISAMSVGVLAYFTPMVFILMMLHYMLSSQSGRIVSNLKQFSLSFGASFVSSLCMFWFIGGILPGYKSSTLDYGFAPFNLNGFFNPAWASHVLQAFPDGGASGEGYAWLGLGVIIGGIYLLSQKILFSEKSFWAAVKFYSPFIFVSSILLVFAATNKVMFGNSLVLSYTLPQKILTLFSVFRTSARFVWPVWYLIVIFIIGGIAALSVEAWKKSVFISVLLFVQIADQSDYFLHLNHRAVSKEAPPLKSAIWGRLSELSIKHVFFIPFSGKLSQSAWGYIAAQAVRQDATINTFWLGRYPMETISENIGQKVQDLKIGNVSDGDLFVVNYIPAIAGSNLSEKIQAYMVDSQIILGRKGLDIIEDSLKPIKVKTTGLSDYLKHLETLDSNFVILVTARQNGTPVALDEAAQQELQVLKIGGALNKSSNFNYVGILRPGRETLFERHSDKPIVLESTFESMLGRHFNVSVSVGTGGFPAVAIDGTDCSHSFIGLNICVYDLSKGKMVEAGAFDLYAMTNGIFLQM